MKTILIIVLLAAAILSAPDAGSAQLLVHPTSQQRMDTSRVDSSHYDSTYIGGPSLVKFPEVTNWGSTILLVAMEDDTAHPWFLYPDETKRWANGTKTRWLRTKSAGDTCTRKIGWDY